VFRFSPAHVGALKLPVMWSPEERMTSNVPVTALLETELTTTVPETPPYDVARKHAGVPDAPEPPRSYQAWDDRAFGGAGVDPVITGNTPGLVGAEEFPEASVFASTRTNC
jgi:hypothetical protein